MITEANNTIIAEFTYANAVELNLIIGSFLDFVESRGIPKTDVTILTSEGNYEPRVRLILYADNPPAKANSYFISIRS